MTPDASRRTVPYAERLTVPWWSWPAALIAAVLLVAEIPTGTGVPIWLPLALAAAATAVVLLWLSRIRLQVTEAGLRVADARLPLDVIAQVVALDAAGKREILGVAAHPLAFVVQRPWIGGAVQVLLDDPDDPTPYWVVSTRRPAALAAAIVSAGPDLS